MIATRTLRRALVLAVVLGAVLAPVARADDPPHGVGHAQPAGAAPAADHVMVNPAELRWADAPFLPPGAQVSVIEGPPDQPVPFTLRLRFPAGYQLPAHRHPGIEHVTVLSGAINMGVGDTLDKTRTTALSTGSMSIMQPGTAHFLWTAEEAIVQVHGVGPSAITYVNPADDPRTK